MIVCRAASDEMLLLKINGFATAILAAISIAATVATAKASCLLLFIFYLFIYRNINIKPPNAWTNNGIIVLGPAHTHTRSRLALIAFSLKLLDSLSAHIRIQRTTLEWRWISNSAFRLDGCCWLHFIAARRLGDVDLEMAAWDEKKKIQVKWFYVRSYAQSSMVVVTVVHGSVHLRSFAGQCVRADGQSKERAKKGWLTDAPTKAPTEIKMKWVLSNKWKEVTAQRKWKRQSRRCFVIYATNCWQRTRDVHTNSALRRL